MLEYGTQLKLQQKKPQPEDNDHYWIIISQ